MTEVSARNVATSLNVEASSGNVPFDTINVNLDLVLHNATKRKMLVAPAPVRTGNAERRSETGDWKIALIVDSFFPAGDPPRCVSLKPGKSMVLPAVASNAWLPKSERPSGRPVWFRFYFFAQCRDGARVVDHSLVTEPIEIHHGD